MYHPGKVIKILAPKDKNIISSDTVVQAVVSMWDDNLFTFVVDTKIAGKLKDNDVVLVDYTPVQNSPAPKHTIVKILRGDIADVIWKKYKEFYTKQAAAKEIASMHSDDYTG